MPHTDIQTYDKLVFAAMSKKTFYLREHIVKFVLEKGYTPTCAFMMFSYFLLDTVDRQALISANNALIKKCDELWVFGPISNGVREELNLAKKINIPIKYFSVKCPECEFEETDEQQAEYEEDGNVTY